MEELNALTPEELAAEVLREARSQHGDLGYHDYDNPNPSTPYTPQERLEGCDFL